MKTPWINYKEMKRVGITRQTVFFVTAAQEQDKSSSKDSKNKASTVTDNDHHDLDTPPSNVNSVEIYNPNRNFDGNHVLDRHRKNDEAKEMSVCKAVKKIKEIQTNHVGDIRSLSIGRSADNNLQGKSRFNHEYISKSDPAPSYIESVITDKALEKLDSTRILEPSEKNDESIKLGISELINVLGNLQAIHNDNPFEVPIEPNSPVIDIEPIIDSQIEYEPVHITIADAPLGYIELERPTSLIEDTDNTVVIELDEEKIDSKEMGIFQLVTTLQKLQTTHTDDSFELSIEPNTPVINEVTKIDSIIDSHIECGPAHITIADAPPGYLELEKSASLIEDTDNTVVIELDEEKSDSKEIGIYRLVTTLQKLQTTHTDDPFELSIEPIIDSHIECEPVQITIADAPPGYIEIENPTNLIEKNDHPVVIKLDEESNESKQISVYRLVTALQKIQTIQTEDPFELSIEPNTPVINEVTEIDSIIDSHIECEPVHITIADAPPGYIEIEKSTNLIEKTDHPVVIKLDEENNESKQISEYRLVNALQKLQTIQTEDPFELSNEYNLPIIDKINEKFDSEVANMIEPTESMDELVQSGKVYCKTIKSPFSTCVEIDNFLHAPIFGEINQNTFEFVDSSNKQSFQLDTKFISTSTYYPEQPSCHLVSSTIHELIYVTNTLHTNETKKHRNYSAKSIMNPIHSLAKIDESSHANFIHDFIKIRVPVVVGEYNIEISIEEEVLFEEEVIRISEVSKNVVMTNCHFTPTQFSKTLGDGTCAATNGVLSVEGLIVQNIGYIAMSDKNKNTIQRKEVINLHEKITLELTIQLLQEQGIRVNYNDIKNYKSG